MKKEHREILIKELSRRLPYNLLLKVHCYGDFYRYSRVTDDGQLFISNTRSSYQDNWHWIQIRNTIIQPYLRSLSKMTKEEKEELEKYGFSFYGKTGVFDNINRGELIYIDNKSIIETINYLDSHYFDYNNLIKKGIALEANEELYKL